MARNDRTGNRKTREQRKTRRSPELGYYVLFILSVMFFEEVHKINTQSIEETHKFCITEIEEMHIVCYNISVGGKAYVF